MTPAEEQMFRTYAWGYFAYHADQRLKTFNFFLLAAGLLAGGITTLLKDGGDQRWVCPLGVVLTMLSVVFKKIDQRNRNLVRNGEDALRYLDSLHSLPDEAGVPHVLRIFDRDDRKTERAARFPITQGHYSYTNCLGFVFGLFGLLGLFFAIGGFFIKPAVKASSSNVPLSETALHTGSAR